MSTGILWLNRPICFFIHISFEFFLIINLLWSLFLLPYFCVYLYPKLFVVRVGVTLKNGKIWDKVPEGGGLTQTQICVQNFLFLETTNFASPYFKPCVTVKIWLNLMHTNLISRLIHATVLVPGGGGVGVIR